MPFQASVIINKMCYASGIGASKRMAKNKAGMFLCAVGNENDRIVTTACEQDFYLLLDFFISKYVNNSIKGGVFLLQTE